VQLPALAEYNGTQESQIYVREWVTRARADMNAERLDPGTGVREDIDDV